MKKQLILWAFILWINAPTYLIAQELYVQSNPASNIPANSIKVALNNNLMYKDKAYRAMPEIMLGISKNIMLGTGLSFSNVQQNFSFEGANLYAKYRFYTHDEVQKHFRMAAYSRIAYSNRATNSEDINLQGDNSGLQLGLVATELLHKWALSAGSSWNKAWLNSQQNNLLTPHQMWQYNASIGYLLLPKVYENYKQTNVNLYAEFLGGMDLQTGKNYLDFAPAVQVILNSRTQIDVGYRTPLFGNMPHRLNTNMLLLRLEFNFFNAL